MWSDVDFTIAYHWAHTPVVFVYSGVLTYLVLFGQNGWRKIRAQQQGGPWEKETRETTICLGSDRIRSVDPTHTKSKYFLRGYGEISLLLSTYRLRVSESTTNTPTKKITTNYWDGRGVIKRRNIEQIKQTESWDDTEHTFFLFF